MRTKLGEDAFRLFAGLPSQERTYAEVAKRLGVCRGTVARKARREGWIARVQAIEKKAREKADEDLAARLAELNERHVKVARFLLGTGVAALQSLKIDKPRYAAEIVELGLRLEREISGVDGGGDQIIEIE